MFLAQSFDHRIRIAEDQPVSCPDRWGNQITRQALRARIDHSLVLGRPADDGRVQMERTFVKVGRSSANGRPVVVDIRADAHLRQPGDFMRVPGIRGTAGTVASFGVLASDGILASVFGFGGWRGLDVAVGGDQRRG